ncbi:MAG: hypothetical protein HYU74_09435 [Dechloromonas sp.]|nr:hypothetical protein [Dechloromonas sp.]
MANFCHFLAGGNRDIPVSRYETWLVQSVDNQSPEIAMDHADHLDRLVFITTLLSALVANLPW